MERRERLTREEIDERHPDLIPALRAHPHIGFLLVRSRRDGALVLGPRGERHLATGHVEGEDPLAPFSPTAAEHLARADGFPHVADIMVNSFYDPELDEGCAFEELISFHGGMGGSQTRPFIMHPVGLPAPDGPIRSAEAVHAILAGWRAMLQGPASGRGDGAARPAHLARALHRGDRPRRRPPGHRPGAPRARRPPAPDGRACPAPPAPWTPR